MNRSPSALRPILLAALCLVATTAAGGNAAPGDPAVTAEIEFLLERVGESDYVFIRNGAEHTGTEASTHMRRKYEHFAGKGDIVTVEDFIDLAGTKSLMSGRPYTVRLPDGSVIPTADWLRAELQARRLGTAGVTR